jgi:hypothetical protein
MWRKTDYIAAKFLRLMHVPTNAAGAILTLCVRCNASVDANLRHADAQECRAKVAVKV